MLRVFLLAAFALVLAVAPAFALVALVKPSPPSGTVALGPSAVFTTTWNIIRGGAPNSPVIVTSPFGEFRAIPAGQRIADTPGLKRSFPDNPNGVAVTETFVIPESVMRWALENNNGRFVYVRSFYDDPPANTPVEGVVSLTVTGGMGGPIGVAQVNLTFDDGTSFRNVPQGQPLKAEARVKSTGSGELDATWEVSEPNPDGSAFYHPIGTVSQSLSGQSYVPIFSPPLPTSNEGRVNVRFRVTNPRNGIDSPVITYFVTAKTGANVRVPAPFDIVAPDTGAVAGKGTVFRWKGIKDAVVYRLQVLDGGSVAASMLVKGTEAPLSAFVIGQLQAPATYEWRVSAINRDGDVIAMTSSRSFKVKSK